MSSPSDNRPAMGTIDYRVTPGGTAHFPPEGDYRALHTMSRVQLKVFGVYLSELQAAINAALAQHPRINLAPRGEENGPA